MTVSLMSNFVRHAINFRENSNGRCKGACGILLESYSSTTKNIATIMSMATKICRGGGGVTYHGGLSLIKKCDPFVTWPSEITRQTKTSIYLHYHNASGHQTCQGGDLSWEAPTHKVI